MIKKKIPDNDFAYQWNFVEWMTSLDARAPNESGLSGVLTSDSLYRLETYQSSFLSRVTSNLSETLFEACENLFGAELVAQILAGYFKFNPPSSESLTDAPANLPEYLRSTAKTREALLFADLAEVCLRRWQVLTASDPNIILPTEQTPLSHVWLVDPVAYIQTTSKHDLAATWETATHKHSGPLPSSLFENRAGLLIAKSSPIDLCLVRIPELLHDFVTALVEGETVEGAVNILEKTSPADEEECAAMVSQLIANLQSKRLLDARNVSSDEVIALDCPFQT